MNSLTSDVIARAANRRQRFARSRVHIVNAFGKPSCGARGYRHRGVTVSLDARPKAKARAALRKLGVTCERCLRGPRGGTGNDP